MTVFRDLPKIGADREVEVKGDLEGPGQAGRCLSPMAVDIHFWPQAEN